MFPNDRGFTLVEVLVSMLILLFGLMGSLLGTMAALDSNVGHVIQEEAVKIAQEQMEQYRNGSYAAVGNSSVELHRQLRKSQRTFQVTTTVEPAPSLKRVTINVQWNFKDRTRSYSLESILRQAI